jgi:hypothetical protein
VPPAIRLRNSPCVTRLISIVGHLAGALPPGSFLVVNHATNVIYGEASDQAVALWNEFGTPPITLRSPQQIGRFFDGLELLEPGVVSCSYWRPETTAWGTPEAVDEFCGVACKPLPAAGE